MSDKVIAPASYPQELFLTIRDGVISDSKYCVKKGKQVGEEVDIVFYGGAAGGGKSFAALMHHLKYIDLDNYRGLVLRRTTPMLMKPGAIWDEAKALYRDVDPNCQIKIKDLKIIIGPKKAEIAFSHFERVDDTNNFQGSQISSVVFDELCHFEESQFIYILSRLRTKANMKPVARATMNPEPDSWVHKWIKWYLYDDNHELAGRPDPVKQGKVRWFVRQDNEMIWADSKEELVEKFPGSTPLSFAFCSANVYDNKYIEKSYIAFLEGLPRIQKEILLWGNWNARPESEGLVRREAFKESLVEPPWNEIVKTVRAYDFASTKKTKDMTFDPDYFCSVKMSKLKNGDYFIHEVERTRIGVGEWASHILKNALRDGKKVDIVIPLDPGASARFANSQLKKEIISEGYFVREFKATGDKLNRFRPVAAFINNGYMHILKDCGQDPENDICNDLNFFYKEVEGFTGKRKSGASGHDDLVDALSDSFAALSARFQLPQNFSIPSLSKTNEFRV